MDVVDLRTSIRRLEKCPVLIASTEDGDDPEECGWPLTVRATYTIRGDDYGSWGSWSVAFGCGHDFVDMEASLRHTDEI
jgi:hypothetical protein